MNDKAKKAKLFDVSLNIKVVGNFMTAIEDIDWCAILANLLDNAIEACEKVTVEERRIDFSLVRKDDMIILDISNPYCGNVKLMDGKLYTLKEDKMLHGIEMCIRDRYARQRYGYRQYTHIPKSDPEAVLW